ncbi:ABC transporter ATP-binding protein [Nocardiopsis deserti]|uniref:ABC transporter ATP-binding protein n=1 Tax=Nocardiopsis deserti TaxID=2605988 RepID=UPI00123B9B14|nr:ABC transporter ATP-binding protein [Nocardiopsis deserti]
MFSWRIAFQVLLILANSSLVVVPALVGQRLIDDGVLQRDTDLVLSLGAVLVALAAAQAVIAYAERVFSASLGERLTLRLREDLFAHLHEQALGFFSYARPGAIVSRLHGDVSGVKRMVAFTVPTATGAVGTLLFAGVSLLFLEWRAAAAVLILAPVMYGLALYFAPRVRAASQRELDAYADLDTCVSEQFSAGGAEAVRLYGARDRMAADFFDRASHVREHALSQTRLGAAFGSGASLTTGVISAAVYVVGGILVASQSMTMGTLVAVIAILGRLYGPITMLSSVKMEMIAGLVSFDRVREVMLFRPTLAVSESLPPEASSSPPAWNDSSSVVLNRVSFAYPPPQKLVVPSLASEHELAETHRGSALHEISLVLRAGATVGLVGHSGAGKSTLTRLLTRTWDADTGVVRIGGTDIRALSSHALFSTVGIVTQETFLFNDTIRANITLARPDASEEDLVRVCRAAQIWDTVRALPEGLDTMVGDRGVRLSGGERQRIALARLFLKAPPVVILDEATSHLDNQTERAVQEAMSVELAGCARLVVAHRLATVRDADQIVVMAHGRIRQRGTHTELLEDEGPYRRLVMAQETVEHQV